MKFLIKSLLILFLPVGLMAQTGTYYDYVSYSQNRIDSLKALFHSNINDTVRMAVCKDFGLYYSESKTDSALYFHTLQLKLAEQLGLKLWVADAHDWLGYTSKRKGNLAIALQHSMEAIKIAEDPDTEKNIWRVTKFSTDGDPRKARLTVLANSIHDQGLIYLAAGDAEKKMNNYRRARAMAESINDYSLMSMINMNLGYAYLHENKPDSALMFEKEALVNAEIASFKFYSGLILSYIGEIYTRMDEYDSAKKYFSESMKRNKDQGNLSYVAYASLRMANLLKDHGSLDSSLYYARMSLNIFNSNGEPMEKLTAMTTLSSIYKKLQLIDSAFVYQEWAIAIKDSINNAEKIIQFQNIGFDQITKVQELEKEKVVAKNRNRTYAFMAGFIVLVLIGSILFRNNRQKEKANAVLVTTLSNLKSTQSQLIQSEKMASLGELTAGIAHEIQNPLNFVNNFSEVNAELIDELKVESLKPKEERDEKLEVELLNTIAENEQKINHHGKRADAIVKGMLQHSRSSSGVKELIDINALADEYLRLAYHGFRAKDKSFNATLNTEYDQTIGNINVVPQDIGRVILNLIMNAFYVVNEKAHQNITGYEPTVSVSTKKEGNKVLISVRDNGSGIPQKILDKIFQPFFTTKPTGQGTGLGLSLSYDIVKAHGGELKVETKPARAGTDGEGSEFIIQLPMS